MSTPDLEAVRPILKGFLVPVYSDLVNHVASFTPADFAKIEAGYACAACHAEFTMYISRCPLCGEQRDIATDFAETPALWKQDWDEAMGPGEATVARSPDEAIRAIMEDPNVEKIQLDKLHRRNRSAR